MVMKIDKNKINFICFLEGNTGYSILSRSLISLIEKAGMDIRVENMYGSLAPGFAHLQQRDLRDRFQFLHQIPTVRPSCDGFYTVTEFDQPPYGSISPIRNAELILTESKFCKQIFEDFTDAEIHVVNYPIDPQFKPKGTQYRFDPLLEEFKFKFLSVFEWIMRKDPYTLIQAFVEEFSPEESVALILRTWSKFENPRKWIGKLAPNHNVFWLPAQVGNLPALYRACDCFVTDTWGEGFGHPVAEALACGMKVIAPDSSGMSDYCNKNNSLVIPTEYVEVGRGRNEIPHLIKPWFKCWKPDKEVLKKAMRRATTNPLTFIRQNAPKVREKFSYDVVLEQIKEAFDLGT